MHYRKCFIDLSIVLALWSCFIACAFSSEVARVEVQYKTVQNVTLSCPSSSPVTWSVFEDPDVPRSIITIFINGKVTDDFKKRFTVDSSTAGYWNLTITDFSDWDEALYVCKEQNGKGPSHSVFLSVTGVSLHKKHYWIVALFLFFFLCIPPLIVCAVFGNRNRHKKTAVITQEEKLLQ